MPFENFPHFVQVILGVLLGLCLIIAPLIMCVSIFYSVRSTSAGSRTPKGRMYDVLSMSWMGYSLSLLMIGGLVFAASLGMSLIMYILS